MTVNRAPRMEVRATRRPGVRTLFWLIVLSIALAALATAFSLGRMQPATQLSAAGLREQSHLVELAVLRAERDELRRQLAVAERGAQVDRQTLNRMQLDLAADREAQAADRDELAFYRRILAERGSALRIDAFALTPRADGGGFDYELVLVRGRPDGKPLAGEVRFESGDGVGAALAHPFTMRYFKTLRGTLPWSAAGPDSGLTLAVVRTDATGGVTGEPLLQQAYQLGALLSPVE